MKITFDKEWCLEMARREGNSDVAAGLLALHPTPESVSPEFSSAEGETRIAFGKLISLMRRKNGLAMEELAEEADVELRELVAIEEGVPTPPEPRTVYKLARVFNLPPKRLLQVSGLTTRKDDELAKEAVRFAARSESIAKLTKEETAALDSFVRVLSSEE
jgi:transcriptional regulator with XRE-family HTH domain